MKEHITKNRIKVLLSKIKKVNGCWEFVGRKNSAGYGAFTHYHLKSAHRFSYFVFKGEIPKGMFVCHRCDNPSCVNPKHLWLGTHKDNYKDMILKKRNRNGSLSGEKNKNSKLSKNDVDEIRKSYKEGLSTKLLASMFGCSQPNIHYIITNQTWNN
jgi:hypothetical protein